MTSPALRAWWQAFYGRVCALLLAFAVACAGSSASPPSTAGHVGIMGAVAALSETLGLSDRPPPPPVHIDILCDHSSDSTCTQESLNETLTAVLTYIADRQHSVLTLWSLGKGVSDTIVIGEAVVPDADGSTDSATTWVAREAARLSLAAAPYLGHALHLTPLAEGLTKIGMSATGSIRHITVVVGDLRAFGHGIDFECGRIPTPAQFDRYLKKIGALQPGSMRGEVILAYASMSPLKRCSVSLDREERVRRLWVGALRAAGVSAVTIALGAPQLNK